jgi:hypothetical protein
VGQERIVERQAGREADVSDAEEQRRHLPVAALNEEERAGCERPDGHENAQQALLDWRVVGYRAQNRRQDRRDRQGDRGGHGEAASGLRRRKVSRRHRGEVHGEDRGDDGGGKRRVRPVVHRPGAQLSTVEAKPVQHGVKTSFAQSIRG